MEKGHLKWAQVVPCGEALLAFSAANVARILGTYWCPLAEMALYIRRFYSFVLAKLNWI